MHNKVGKDEKKSSKSKGKKEFKSYKYKVKKYCFMAKDLDSSEDDEMVYIAIKDESNDV